MYGACYWRNPLGISPCSQTIKHTYFVLTKNVLFGGKINVQQPLGDAIWAGKKGEEGFSDRKSFIFNGSLNGVRVYGTLHLDSRVFVCGISLKEASIESAVTTTTHTHTRGRTSDAIQRNTLLAAAALLPRCCMPTIPHVLLLCSNTRSIYPIKRPQCWQWSRLYVFNLYTTYSTNTRHKRNLSRHFVRK